MKAILKSIRPQHDKNILNGLKLIELDKSAPKEWKDYLSGKTKEKPKPREVFIYCTKDLNALLRFIDNRYMFLSCSTLTRKQEFESGKYLNGKVVAKFTLNKVEKIEVGTQEDHIKGLYQGFYSSMNPNELLNKSCINSCATILEYAGFDFRHNDNFKCWRKNIYAWHIDDLVIFDKPKELSEFEVWGIDYPTGIIDPLHDCNVYYKKKLKPLTRAPQSWCYVEI